MKKTLLFFVTLFLLSFTIYAQDMVLKYNTNLSDGTTITLPLSGTVNVTVDWGDGNSESVITEGLLDHTYATDGTYTVTISGTLTGFGVNHCSNIDKLIAVTDFGNLGLVSLSYAFAYAVNLTQVPNSLPSTVEDLGFLFRYATNFNFDISNWDVKNVTNMAALFSYSAFNRDISGWDVSSVTSMRFMFDGDSHFNQDLNSWDVSHVTEMDFMFYGDSAFNGNIGSWNVSSVTNIGEMFQNATSFNQDLNNWDVSHVTYMYQVFNKASSFNGNISNWDVSSVTTMWYMFNGATSFNQDISSWDVSKVTNFGSMFYNASAFDQNLASWNVTSATAMDNMFTGSALSHTNYDAILNGWAAQAVQSSVAFGAGDIQYSSSASSARNTLTTTYSWTITDGGLGCFAPSESVTDITFGTGTHSTITLTGYTAPVNGVAGYAIYVNSTDSWTAPTEGEEPTANLAWNNAGQQCVYFGTSDNPNITVTNLTENTTYYFKIYSYNDCSGTEKYENGLVASTVTDKAPMVLKYNTNLSAGTTITLPLSGTVDVSVDWGDGNSESVTTEQRLEHTYATDGTYTVLISGSLSHFGYGIPGSDKLIAVTDFGNLGLTSLSYAFYNAINLTQVPDSIPSTVTKLSGIFEDATSFNQNINSWNVSSVIDMRSVFERATSFNQDISSWDVHSVYNMYYMFFGASSFNQDISSWNVSNVNYMGSLFKNASSFNQDISSWNVGKVIDMAYMFQNASLFDQNLGSWDITSVTSMDYMFDGVTISTSNYDAILNGWAAQTVQTNVKFNGGNSLYSSASATSRQHLINDKGWTITDGGSTQTTWDGTSWSYGAPGAATDVVLNGDFTTTEAIQCNDLIISAGVNLTAMHPITVNGNLTLKSKYSGTASVLGNSNISVTGKSTVECYLLDYTAKSLFWHYVSIPVDVSGGTVNSSVFGTPYNNGGADYYALYYDESIPDYVGITDNTTVLSQQMRGYAVPENSTETLQFTGDLVSGTKTISLTNDKNGFNLIGNPYPSGINLGSIDAGLTGINTTGIATTVWVREYGNFNEYNWQSGTSVVGSFTGVLPPMQAVWVKVADGQSSGSIQVTEDARVNSNRIVYKSDNSNVLRLSLSKNNLVDNVAIGLYPNATEKFENYDSEKMFSEKESDPQMFMRVDNHNLGINGLVDNLDSYKIPLGVKIANQGVYSINVNNVTEFDNRYSVLLKDNKTGETIDLRKQNSYEFYTDSINSLSRFEIVLSKSTTYIQTVVNNINIYSADKSIIINSNSITDGLIVVYDAYGRTIMSNNISLNRGINKIEINQEPGVYLVNVRTNNYNSTERIIIK